MQYVSATAYSNWSTLFCCVKVAWPIPAVVFDFSGAIIFIFEIFLVFAEKRRCKSAFQDIISDIVQVFWNSRDIGTGFNGNYTGYYSTVMEVVWSPYEENIFARLSGDSLTLYEVDQFPLHTPTAQSEDNFVFLRKNRIFSMLKFIVVSSEPINQSSDSVNAWHCMAISQAINRWFIA